LDFLAPHDIRVKGTRIGIEHILYQFKKIGKGVGRWGTINNKANNQQQVRPFYGK